MSAFPRALAFTLRPDVEGAYSNHPRDRGGSTNHGITQRLYDAWRAKKKLPPQDVRIVTDIEINEISLEEFWIPAGCDLYPEALGIAVFDMAFHSNPNNAKRTLQRALGVKVDGVVGEQTLRAVAGTPDVVTRFLIARGAFWQDEIIHRPNQVVFLEGWIKRLILLTLYTQRPK